MKNKIMMFVLLGMILLSVSSVSAFEFDNVKSYDSVTREVTIKNAFGLGADIGKARLNTPLNYKVAPGYQKVAEFDLWAYQDYADILKSIEFYDKNQKDWEKAKFEQEFDLKYKTYEDVLVDDFKTECIKEELYYKSNQTIYYNEICEKIKVGSHYESREIWEKINPATLKKNEVVTIGIFTEVKIGDYVEWIPQIYGVRVVEWATWTSANCGTGGVVTIVGNDCVNTFNSSETFNLPAHLSTEIEAQVLVVAGGGGGSKPNSYGSGAGGAGGLIYDSSYNITSGNHSVTIGTGGAGGSTNDAPGISGTNSVFGTMTAIGGGYGGGETGAGGNGGSGGGSWTSGAQGLGTAGQGNNGGSGSSGCGGGGFSAVGTCGGTNNGGAGVSNSISGTSQTYSKGGDYSPQSAPEYYGYGGDAWGFAGFNGIVIIRYPAMSGDVAPNIILNSPSSENFTSPQNIQMNFTAWDDINLSDVKLYVNGILNQTNASGLNNSIYLFDLTLGDGDYLIYGKATDNESQSTDSSSIRIYIDSQAPNLTLNQEITNQTTLTLPINVTLNYSATDSNLSSCWYEYNATNTTFTCNTTQTINVTTSGAHSINYYANDTLGNLASNSTSFYVYYITRNATATNPITEGGTSSHSFYLNMTDIINFNSTAELFWNGTSQGLGTKTILNNNSLRFDKTLIVPSINGTSVNWTWVYNIQENPNVTDYNLTGSQTYIKVNISECGAGTYQILNYTLYDQDTRAVGTTANASIEVDLTLTSQANESLSWQYHSTKSSSTSFLICLPSGALNNSAYNLDSVSKYSYQDHVVQYHYIENFNLTNDSIPQLIKLYDLATAKSTSFLVNYQDENYIYVENAVIDVWRRYVGDGVFFSVEHGKTDASGQTRLHLVTEDIIYKFLVWQDGELVYTSPEYLALCQATPCQINLRKTTDESEGLSERDNLLYDYEFNETTRTASFTFATKDNTQTEINMTIYSSNQYANETACSTTLTTSGGQIDCIIPFEFANTSYQTIITRDGQYFGTAFDSLAPKSMDIFGYTGLILTAIAYLLLALMGISSGIATIIFGIIGLVFMGIIQIFESGNVFGMASAIIWLIVAGVIIIIKITKRRIQ